MIYPTARAVVLAALGAPAALLVGLIAPGYWVLAGAWLVLLFGLVLVDALVGPRRSAALLTVEAPGVLGAGARGEMTLRAVFEGAAPATAELAVQTNVRLAAEPERTSIRLSRGAAAAAVALVPLRRGEGEISSLWLRWRGELGLVWKQVTAAPRHAVAITPDVPGVKAEAVRLFSREALFGLKTQLETGEGSEFHALREVGGAADPRAIDWKQSARHGKLLGKEFRVERNHPVIFALDTGRTMSEPLLGVPRLAIPRLDWAINAALLLAYVCLKTGDLAGVFDFGVRGGAFSGVVSGVAGMARLQRHLAGLDYGEDETNYTLGLSQLGAALKRRSLIVVFTDFADATSAELMVENLTRLLRRHEVLFVVMRDEALEAIARAEPATPEAVTRAVTAHGLMRARDLVLARLTRLGVRIVDAPVSRVGAALISAYLDLKRADAV